MTERDPLVLVIEDDEMVREYLKIALSSQKYQVIEAENGRTGLELAANRQPDLIVLDLGLPDMNGIQVTQQLREWTNVPILILSGQRQERDKVEALDAGADDYVTKPFGVEELLARVRVALRHANLTGQVEEETLFTSGELRLDWFRRLVFVGDKEVRLTPIEYRLLSTLARRADQAVSHRQLLKEVWGPEYARKNNYLRIYMKHLRDKLEKDPAKPEYLLSEQGVGYRLKKIESSERPM
ncbi:response regulator [bacterium]|nr:MAG: response regulator [bacterium]